MEAESPVSGIFGYVFMVFKIIPSLFIVRGNFIILVLCPQQLLVYITVVSSKKYIFSFHPLVYVVVQFYPWFNFYFYLFYTHYHT